MNKKIVPVVIGILYFSFFVVFNNSIVFAEHTRLHCDKNTPGGCFWKKRGNGGDYRQNWPTRPGAGPKRKDGRTLPPRTPPKGCVPDCDGNCPKVVIPGNSAQGTSYCRSYNNRKEECVLGYKTGLRGECKPLNMGSCAENKEKLGKSVCPSGNQITIEDGKVTCEDLGYPVN